MKNTLNPCNCNNSSSGGSASGISYDGLTVDCIPVTPGQNLATIIKNIGDFICGLEGRTQVVTVSTDAPTGGGEGDIWFRQQGSNITVYQRISGSWVIRGNLPTGGITPDLQITTNEGNITDNAIQVSGTQNTDPGTNSAVVRFTGTQAILSAIISGAERGIIALGNGAAGIAVASNGNRLDISTSSGARFVTGAGAGTFMNVKGADAVSDDDFVTKRQLGSAGPSYTPDPSLPSGAGFLAYLRSNYTSAKPGDVVYREGTTQLIKCTCYYVDANPALNKWSKIIETIE